MNNQFFINQITKNYNLRHHNQNKPSPIYLIIRANNKQYKIPLGVKVLPQHWNKNKAMISILLSDLDNNNNNLVNKKIFEYDNKYSSFIDYICNHIDETDDIGNIISRHFNMGRKKKVI